MAWIKVGTGKGEIEARDGGRLREAISVGEGREASYRGGGRGGG